MILVGMYEPNGGKVIFRCSLCRNQFASCMSFRRHQKRTPTGWQCMARLEMMELGWRKRRGIWWLPRFMNDQPMITVEP